MVKQPGDSQFWAGLMEVKEHLLDRGKFDVKNGEQVRFWVGHKPLMKQFPDLYSIVRRRNQTVASALNSTPLNIAFRRAIVGDKLRQWWKQMTNLCERQMIVLLSLLNQCICA